MHTTNRIALIAAVAAASCVGMASAAAPTPMEKEQAALQFRMDNPNARIAMQYGKPYKIASPRMAVGVDAFDSANKARESLAPMLGVDPAEFIEVGPFPNGAHHIQLGHQPETDTYKFTSVYWTQTADGLPVWRTRLNVLVRNADEFPAVYATSDLRDVAGFEAPEDIRPNMTLARSAATRFVGINSRIVGNPVVVCYAGIKDMRIAPTAAMIFEAEVGSKLQGTFEKFLLVVDLETGAILHDENRIVHDVSGTVNSQCTAGSGADECEDEILYVMPYLTVNGGGNSAYTDINGNFTLPSSGSVTVTAGVSGQFFAVNNVTGGETSASTTIPDGGVGDITLNAANNDESVRAQVNSYRESNVVRDMILAVSPSYPVISTETEFPVNVMVSGSCNAFYDYSSINFYPASGGCNNTAFSVVVHHEYGHHLVATGGSGQDSYGEGMGDALGVIITGDPQLARGFYQGDCSNGIRDADNDFQYPCTGGGSVHYCGQLLSACVWDMLLQMEAYSDGTEIVSRLVVDSVTLHSGGSIDPTITLDILTLDDDDGDLDNGTPHSPEILTAMALHSMDELPEPLGNDFCSDAYVVADGSTSFSTVGAFSGSEPYDEAQCSGTYLGAMNADVWFVYDACESGSMTVSTCDTVSFDSDLVVYSGTCDSLTQVACNGDGAGCGNYTSSLTFNAVEGTSYLIRVGGWDSSAIGSGNLVIDGPGSGPPCESLIVIDLPNGQPALIDPAGGTTVDVTISASDAQPDGPGYLNVSSNGGEWSSYELTSAGGDNYVATFPALECGFVDWNISVMADTGEEVTYPAGGYLQTPVYTDLVVAIDDDFETDLGWSVSNGATEGNWVRAVPANGGVRCDNPTDADGSGACYLTGNGANEDLDGGPTVLTSPVIECSSGSMLSYWRWYNNGTPCNGADPLNDIMEVDISYDGGSSWEVLEVVGPTGDEVSGGWFNPSFQLTDVPNGTVVLRFTVADAGAGSVIEAALDGVKIEKPNCEDGPDCPGDLDGNGIVDVNDVLALISAWGGPDGDVNGDGTTNVDDVLIVLSVFGDPC